MSKIFSIQSTRAIDLETTNSTAIQAIATMASFIFFGLGWALITDVGLSIAGENQLASTSPSSYPAPRSRPYHGDQYSWEGFANEPRFDIVREGKLRDKGEIRGGNGKLRDGGTLPRQTEGLGKAQR